MSTSESSGSSFKEFRKPVPVNSKVFRVIPLEPSEGVSVNIKIMNRNGGAMIVGRADVPELIADLQAAYGLG